MQDLIGSVISQICDSKRETLKWIPFDLADVFLKTFFFHFCFHFILEFSETYHFKHLHFIIVEILKNLEITDECSVFSLFYLIQLFNEINSIFLKIQ